MPVNNNNFRRDSPFEYPDLSGPEFSLPVVAFKDLYVIYEGRMVLQLLY